MDAGPERRQSTIPRMTYSMQIPRDGHVLINIVHYEEALRALDTLAQLFTHIPL